MTQIIQRMVILLCLCVLQTNPSKAQSVIQTTGGSFNTLFLKSDGSLWGMGDNLEGALGLGNFSSTSVPEKALTCGVTAIAAGADSYSLFLKGDGSLWGMGLNGYGQLADLPQQAIYVNDIPEVIVTNNVTAVSAGGDFTLFLKSDGSLWGMGENAGGALGDGTYITTNVPQEITPNSVKTIAAGLAHSLFLKNDGSLWAMGFNSNGQLGDGTFNETNLPEEIVSNGVTAIAGGGYHSLFLKNDGSLWAMGANYDGQLGDGISYKGASETNRPEMIVGSNVTAIAAGYDHSLFLKSDGSLWAMGGNSYGQLGAGNINSTNRPALIIMNNVIGIGAGQNFSMFIKSDGSLWAMGFNDYGQLGDGTENNTNRPEMIVAPPGYGQLSGRYLEGGRVLLFFAGVAGGNYAVDRTFSLSPSNWLPLITNSAASSGDFIFTNPPMGGTNGFWRVRAIQ